MSKSIEIKLNKKDFLISETDSKGVVRFANDDFCKYAGFTLEELVGQNHNIVRDPEMPKAAFADLWQTIKSGNIWKGFVKNSTKNGNFYWVYATVYPFTSSDGSQGYISCRRQASDQEIKTYTALYKEMKAKEQ